MVISVVVLMVGAVLQVVCPAVVEALLCIR